ncbi:MAG: GAF domain-containing sensor histidine kinase [Calothrix sp. C42_A2020_038]|nr:GAF domain-containing sensor histidine kinase [Calothrix sp. C42_A2020_038]
MTEALPERNLTLMLTTQESGRLQALHRYKILDTSHDIATFDELTQLAAQICQTPVALITFVDADQQLYQSSFGANVTQAPLEDGFCPFVVQSQNTLIIPDTLADSRFATNPVVISQPGVRFYAGVPLNTKDDYCLGTLCVLDYLPRQLTPEQINSLEILARQVMTQLELRFTAHRISQIDAALLKVTQGVANDTGEVFFHALVQHFTEVLDVDYSYIGLVVNYEEEAIQTVSACAHGQIIENFSYLLRDTPCHQVIQQRQICCYPRGVQALFPNAPLLAPLGIESYIAIPFFDLTDRPIGLLGVMDSKPLTNIQLAESLLTVFALRIGTEVERQKTEEKQIEIIAREQQARQIAETANQLKDEFLAVLSHELRTPLNPILGWVNLLRTRSFNATQTAIALETIERNAQSLTHLIEDLIDISRLMQGKLSLNIAPINLATIINGAIDTLHLAAASKSIKIQTQIEPNIPQVDGDAVRLTQVVWNLISNALKFTPEGGQINVELKLMDAQVQIQVSDTGKGISRDFLPHVFDYFRTSDGTTTRQFGGLGLGLAIVRQIVELHGGTVNAESFGEGQGSCFTVKIPIMSQRLTNL